MSSDVEGAPIPSAPTGSASGEAVESHPTRRLQAPTPRAALLILALVILGAILYLARGALSPFVVGLVLIYILDPPVERLARVHIGRMRVPRAVAVLVVYVLVAVLMVWAGSLLLGPLVRQISDYLADLPAILAALGDWYRTLELPDLVRRAVDGLIASGSQAATGIDPSTLLPIARSVFGFVASFFGYLIIPVWAFYLLKDRPSLTASMNRSIPATWRRDVWACVGIFNHLFGRWLRGQLLLGVIVGVATFVGLELLGFVVDPRFTEFAVLLAVVAGVLELLPIIGPIISMVPTLVVALTVRDPAQGLIAVVILYTVVQQLENNVLVPLVQGDAVDLHPSVVILALILGGSIAGFLGAVFAVPLTAAGRDIYRYFFRRLSPDDATVPSPDDPDLLPFRDRLPDASGHFPEPREILREDDDAISTRTLGDTRPPAEEVRG